MARKILAGGYKMKNATTIAITKLVSGRSKVAKEAREALNPGEYEIDTTVHITGTMKIGEAHEIAPTASILNADFLTMVLHHAGITRDAATKLIEKVASDYLVDWTGSDEDKEEAKAARKAKVEEIDPDGKIKAIFSEFKNSLPRIPSKGKVTWKGNVSEIEAATPADIEIGVVADEEPEIETA